MGPSSHPFTFPQSFRCVSAPRVKSWSAEPNEAVGAMLRSNTGIDLAADNAELAEKAEVILIGVKPAVVVGVIERTAGNIEGTS
jgi:pyrroline-5-carboxylate reductase